MSTVEYQADLAAKAREAESLVGKIAGDHESVVFLAPTRAHGSVAIGKAVTNPVYLPRPAGLLG